MNEGKHYNAARTVATGNKTLGLPQPHLPHLHQIAGSRVTEVQSLPLHQCHQGPTDLEVQGIDTMTNAARSPEVT